MSSSAPALKPLTPLEQGMLELVPRGGGLDPYTPIPKNKLQKMEIAGDMIAYASPDSTYAVTKRLVDAAKKNILIGIYDFTAPYMKQLLLDAMSRGVKLSLMLDIDSAAEQTIFNDLKRRGCDAVVSPSKASKHLQMFRSSHEKVIVIDDEWCLVQSGNYSQNSIPLNEKDGGDPTNFRNGNRDMGLAVRSKELAKLFTFVLRRDMDAEKKAEREEGVERAVPAGGEGELLLEAPSHIPKLFSSKTFPKGDPVPITPILSPDNYMSEIPRFLASAKKSVYIEQQYIRCGQTNIDELLKSIPKGVEVKIIVAVPIVAAGKKSKDIDDIKELAQFGYKIGPQVRLLNPKEFVHCHNKLIVVDGKKVLVSSQNWSDAAVTENREAGLLIENAKIAQYYQTIFLRDFETALTALPKGKAAQPELAALESMNSGKRMVAISLGDYAEV